MRAYFLIFALVLLPHLVLSHPGQPSYINKVFARRTRNSPKYVGSTPRQVRFSRYIQEPELQEVQQKLQQSTDDVDLEQEIEQQQQLTDTSYGAQKGTTKSTSYTQTPFFSETSTARPQQQQVQQQMKDDEDELSQLSQPLSQQQGEFDAELSQNYMPTQELSYSPVKQMKERNGQRLSQQSYGASSFGGSNGNGANYGGSAGSGGSGFGGSTNSESLDDFGFSEDDNTIGSMKDNIRGEPGKDYPVFSSVPTTGFKCSQQSFPGYYGDVEALCQVFHICQADGRSNAFLCPNGTIFSQRHFVCVWWYEFDCSTTEQFYDLNAELYKESEARAAQGGGISGSGGIIGGSVPSGLSEISGKLNSPKENLNKMYMAQIDEFSGVTTSSPSYYGSGSNGKTSHRGNGGFKGFSQTTQQPVQQYESSVESVTPSILDSQNYETTPYNLDEALGEEIHSETPIIEALSLTTNVPKIQSPKSYGISSARKGGNGNGYSAKGSNGNSYGSSKNSNGNGSSGLKGNNGNGNYYGSTKSSAMSDYGFGDEFPKPSYGGSKGLNGKSNGKTSPKQMLSQLPEAPVKGGRNGSSTKSTKSMYGGTGNGNGLNIQKSPASNGFKSYSSPSSYGGLKQ